MPVESIGGPTASSAQAAQESVVSQEDLFRILLTQLNYQDPLKPADNAEFIAQLAQFTSLEQARQGTANVEALLKMQAADQSIGLIGKTVEVTTATSREVGQVTTVAFVEGSPLLTVRTTAGQFLSAISLSQVQIVR
jgi:flagellar basal-body rod modification protein FlgD